MLSKEEWLDINNPYLRFLPNADKQIPANNRDFSVNEDYDVLVVPSIDQYGYQKELKSGKIVVVIENEDQKIANFLNDPAFIPHQKFYIVRHKEEEMLFVAKKILFKKIHFVQKMPVFQSLLAKLTLNFSEYRDMGEVILPNIGRNLLHVSYYIDGRDMVNILKGEEICVFGSGISIKKAILQLKKRKQMPYILATGSSLPILVEEGIIPDFFAALDPDPGYKNYACLKQLSIPIFYQNRVCSKLLSIHSGPKIFMGSAGGWKIENSLQKKVGQDNFFFDGGSHAGNFGVHIALILGCSKIYIAGMDGVCKKEEKSSMNREDKKTKPDLFYGMEFFEKLQVEYKDQQLIHFTEGFTFQNSLKIKELDVREKNRDFCLPKEVCLDSKKVKTVLSDYFSDQIFSLFSRFQKLQNNSLTKAEISYLLAELSFFPIYDDYFCAMKDIWKDVFVDLGKNDLYLLTFYYQLWKKIPGFTGVRHGIFYFLGKKEGDYHRKDKNGVIREKGYYVNDQLHYEFCRYDENGKKIVVQAMNEGKKDGKYEFYRDEHIARKGAFKNGKAHGEHRTYEKGILVDSVLYEDGKKVGTHIYYDDKGRKKESLYYHDGMFDRTEYTSDGAIVYRGKWENGCFLEENYTDGKIVGKRRGKIAGKEMIYEDLS